MSCLNEMLKIFFAFFDNIFFLAVHILVYRQVIKTMNIIIIIDSKGKQSKGYFRAYNKITNNKVKYI